jgi:DNA polymerase-3 subunit gamma/tau
MCAQVLLPAAATDEKSLLARLERLESAARTHDAEQTRPGSPSARLAPRAERADQPEPAEPAPAPARQAPAADQSEQARPAPARQAPGPRTAETPPQAAAPAAQSATGQSAAGQSRVDALRENWPTVLDAVRRESRVAWVLFNNTSVYSLEDGILTLRFPRDGDLKAFSASRHDAVLKRVLSSQFGLDVMLKGVAGGEPKAPAAAPGPRPGGSGPGGPGPGQAASRPSVTGPPAAAQPPYPGPAGGLRDEPYPGPAGLRDEAAADDGLPDEMPDEPDDLPPDDMPSDAGSSSGSPELTGMPLIQRELGGQVIGEFDA